VKFAQVAARIRQSLPSEARLENQLHLASGVKANLENAATSVRHVFSRRSTLEICWQSPPARRCKRVVWISAVL